MASQSGLTLSSSPRQWKLLSDRIEKNIEDVLNEVVPPRAQTAPPRAAQSIFEDLIDAGHDLRLDLAYPDFYRDHGFSNAHLPTPLDTTTLFNNLAKQLLDDQARGKGLPDLSPAPQVQQILDLVQGLQEAQSRARTPNPAVDHAEAAQSLADEINQLRVNTPDPLSHLGHASQTPHGSTSRAQAPRAHHHPHHDPHPPDMSTYSSGHMPAGPGAPAPHQAGGHPDPRHAFPVPAGLYNPVMHHSGQLYSGGHPHLYPGSHHLDAVHPADAAGPGPAVMHDGLVPLGPAPGVLPTMPPYPQPLDHSRGVPAMHMPPAMPPQPHAGYMMAPHVPEPVAPGLGGPYHGGYYAGRMAPQGSLSMTAVDSAGNIVPLQELPYGPHAPPRDMALREYGGSGHHLPYYAGGAPGGKARGGRHGGPHDVAGARLGRHERKSHPGHAEGLQHSLASSGSLAGAGDGGFHAGHRTRSFSSAKDRKLAARDRGGLDSPDADLTLADLTGKVLAMAKEQNGCRYLQKLITGKKPEQIQPLLDEVLEHVGELMVDPFGNYLVQKVLDVCSRVQRRAILDQACAGDLCAIACNTHGTRAVQKLVESVHSDEEIAQLVAQLKPHNLKLIMDGNGNHVVQRCLHKFGPQRTEPIYEVVLEHCFYIARHRHGCCVLQRCCDYAAPEARHRIAVTVAQHGLQLSQNAFGNYVVQYILDAGIVDACNTILGQLTGHFAQLSCQKFSSNVVESALKLSAHGLEHWHEIIVRELIDAPNHAALLKDQFGNYVLQSALRATSGDLHSALVAAIKPHLHCLKNLQHGKRILQQLQGSQAF